MSKQTCCDKNMGEPFTCGQLSQEVRHLQQRITELEQLASRYAGAVEVEGCWITERGNIHVPSCNQSLDHIEANKKVRVLVMKEEM